MTMHAASCGSIWWQSLNLIGMPAAQPVLWVLLVLLALAAYSDLRDRRIPNWLTFPAAVLGIAMHASSDGSSGLYASALAYALGFSLGLFLYAVVLSYGIGAGDLKLLAASAAFVGFVPMLYLATLSFAVHVLWMMLGWFVKGAARANFTALLRWLLYLLTPRAAPMHFIPLATPERSPHAPFILVAAVAFYGLWRFEVVIP